MFKQALRKPMTGAVVQKQQRVRSLHRDAPYLFSMPAEVDAARKASVATPTASTIPNTSFSSGSSASSATAQQSAQRRGFSLYQDAPYLFSLPDEVKAIKTDGSPAATN
ncbi:hypothetical protein MCOR25_007769 [Pyricularia grisea]|uniref:Uncharacterized protein n=1 Tax=Pyricularia grisea TaxID=148305 RepID=A0A6P8BL39_PYRGI|nr:uncharacterized protein PgNI_02093 [Pyricularia grisea]KAI6357071.1 hypothetical protein MCOR25_007769 [Pyricularia grisea]TLD17513.1 hypothetical protein PgNI_02093 [Pyricularia grisea]